VPREHTHAHAVYLAMRQGMKAAQIAIVTGRSRAAVRVEMFRIRRPDRANAAAALYRNRWYRAWRAEQRAEQQ
jgi:hypothetical protein